MSLKQLARENRVAVFRLLADPTQERRFVISRSLAMQRATESVDRREALPNPLKFHWQ